jgi:signal transduction histidine kinase
VRRPRLRTIFLIVNLLILLLPVGSVAMLRLYESELIRRTQAELIAQGALVAAMYRREYERLHPEIVTPSATGDPAAPFRPPPLFPPRPEDQGALQPIPPELDLAKDPVWPSAPSPQATAAPPDPEAALIGDMLSPYLTSAAAVTLAGIRVVDRQGIVVGSSRGEIGWSLWARDEVRQALAGAPVSRLRARLSDERPPPLHSLSRGTRVRVFVALPIFAGGEVRAAVMLSRTPIDIAKALFLNRAPLLWVALALVVVVILVSVLMSLTISRPIRALMRQSERSARGEKGAVVGLDDPGTHEVALLSAAFARMAGALEQRAEYIRDFAAHVSHEFKTPLTAIRGSVELLRDHGDTMTPADRERFFRNLSTSAERLDRLVRHLLELARADTARPTAERIDPSAVLTPLVDRYRSEGLNVTAHWPATPLTVAMTAEVFAAIVSNLLDNARQHAGPHAAVRIELQPAGEDDAPRVEIVVQDDGPGISPANAARVFTPFFTTAREQGGTGLGLAIVRSLVRAHHGEITLEPATRGARFKIDLPV